MKNVCVLGSTGTIGGYTLEIIDSYPNQFKVFALSAKSNLKKLYPQIQKYQPKYVCLEDKNLISELKHLNLNCEFVWGDEGLEMIASHSDVDIVITGLVGFSGLRPTLAAIKANKTVGLSNKESLVVAGNLFHQALKNSTATCIPVDSEHFAIYQCLHERKRTEVSEIILTASGGPLFHFPDKNLDDVTPEFAVNHPKWKMGPKISVDSATLMNKGLEVIEASVLFNIDESKIGVYVHPQSIVHGLIWFTDNTSIAQLSKPDMKSSIGYALSHPNRLSKVIEKLDLTQMKNLEFYPPDLNRFPCLSLAREALKQGASHVITLNAANEIFVNAFLENKIKFSMIPKHIYQTLEKHETSLISKVDDIFQVDQIARKMAISLI